MSWHRAGLTLIASLSLCGCRTEPECPTTEVVAFVEAFENPDSSERSRGDAILELASGCRTLNRGGLDYLQEKFGPPQSERLFEMGKESFTDLMSEVCANGNAAVISSHYGEHEEVFKDCDFGRFGLLESAEDYEPIFKPAFVLAYDLGRAGVERGLVQRAARSVIAVADAGPPGIGLPRARYATPIALGGGATIDVDLRGEAPIFGVAPYRSSSGSASSLSLELERFASSLGARIDEMLGGSPQAGRARKRRDFIRALTVQFIVRPETKVEPIVQMMREAQGVGVSGFAFLVNVDRSFGQMPVEGVPFWPGPEELRLGKRGSVEAFVGVDEVMLRSVVEGGAPRQGAVDEFRKVGANDTDHNRLEVIVDPDVSVEQLIDQVETLLGHDCRPDSPVSCQFTSWTLRLDNQPLERDWKQVELAFSSDQPVAKKGLALPLGEYGQMREHLQQALPRIQTCMREAPQANLIRGDQLLLAYGDDPKGRGAVYVVANESRGTLPRQCIAEALKLRLLDHDERGRGQQLFSLDFQWR